MEFKEDQRYGTLYRFVWNLTLSMDLWIFVWNLSIDSNIKYGILKFCMNFHAIVWLVACPQT